MKSVRFYLSNAVFACFLTFMSASHRACSAGIRYGYSHTIENKNQARANPVAWVHHLSLMLFRVNNGYFYSHFNMIIELN